MKPCGDFLEAIREKSEEIVAAASKAFEDGGCSCCDECDGVVHHAGCDPGWRVPR